MQKTNVIINLCGLLGLSFSTGCTFSLLDGNGPLDRENVAEHLPMASTNELAQWKREAETLPNTSDWSALVRKELREDYTFTYRKSDPFFVTGSEMTRLYLLPNDTDKRSVLEMTDSSGFKSIDNFPWYLTVDGKSVDAETGECLANGKGTGWVFALIAYGNKTTPVTTNQGAIPEHLFKEKKLKDVKYDNLSYTCIGWGVLAWGQKNNRAYFQLAWIPIPLWSVK